MEGVDTLALTVSNPPEDSHHPDHLLKHAQSNPSTRDSTQRGAPNPPPRFSSTFWSPDLVAKRAVFIKGMVLTLILTLAFMWICVPVYFGSLAHQRSYSNKLKIWFIDMDGGDIGSALKAVVQANINSPTKAKLGWVIKDPTEFSSVNDIAHQVVEERAWAAVVVSANATAKLVSARENGDATYNGTSTVTLFLDTGRNELATNNYVVPYSEALLSSAIAKFSTLYAAQYFSAQSGNATAMRAISAAPQTITVPVAFSSVDLRPFSAPVASALTLVGSIYVIIFAFIVTLAGYALRAPIEPFLTLKDLIILRIFVPLLLYVPLSLGYAMISLCFHVPFNAKFTYAGGFFLYWVFVFLTMAALGLATEAMITLLAPRFIPYFLFPLIISNVSVASIPIALEPWFYKYGYAFPVYNLGQATRTLIFNTKSHLGLNAGVLIAWLVISFITLPFFIFLGRRKAVQNTQRASDNDIIKSRADTSRGDVEASPKAR